MTWRCRQERFIGELIFLSVANVHSTTKGHREVAFQAEGATRANAKGAGVLQELPEAW